MKSGGKPSGGLAGKLMLSGALILASGAYVWRTGTQQNAPVVPNQALPKLIAQPRPAAPPMAEAPPQAAPMARPLPQRLLSARATDDGQVAPTQERAVPPPAEIAPLPQSQAATQTVPETPDKPAVLASNTPPAPVPQKAARYADGEYTGQPADAVWGLIQVKVEIRSGVIASIECIDYPNHRRRSIQINAWALPLLDQEAIAAQSAEIDIVTQATTTSVGYRQTLATALAQARP